MEDTQPKSSFKLSGALIIASAAFLLIVALSVFTIIYTRNINLTLRSVSNNNQLLQQQIQQVRNGQLLLAANVNRQQLQLNSMRRMAAGDQRAWQLAEVDYLVRLASYNLSYSQDAPAALALLQTADRRLAQLNDPDFNQIRQQLANVIAPLQVIAKADIAGILAKLTALQQQVQELALITPPDFNKNKTNAAANINEPKTLWEKITAHGLDTLKSLVIIRRHQEPIEPLLDAEQFKYLRQNLQWQLQQAQWAVLHGKQALYQNSLQQAIVSVRTYFASENAQAATFIQNLTELQQIKIQPALPSLDAVLDAIAQVQRVDADKAKQDD